MSVIPGSHTYGVSIQEAAAREGILRDDRTDDIALRLARSQSSAAEIIQPDVADGDALLFDGRLWHGSRNTASETIRASLLLQYARSDRHVRIPATFEWPFQFKDDERAPAIVVSGRGDETVNHLVPAPSMRAASAISPRVHRIDPALACPEGVPFRLVPCFTGCTDNVDYLECHYSVLMPGCSPHLPHRHVDEEILVVMSGAAELVVAGVVGVHGGAFGGRVTVVADVDREAVVPQSLGQRVGEDLFVLRDEQPHVITPCPDRRAGRIRNA